MAFAIRRTEKADAGTILTLLRALAEYEKLLTTFTLSERGDPARDFFGDRPVAECDLPLKGGEPVGLVTYYWTYASFRAVRGLFVEDLFVLPEFRGQGIGLDLLRYGAATALAAGATRLEWRVLDWNAPAIAFYKGLGARRFEGWDTYRLEDMAMQKLAGA